VVNYTDFFAGETVDLYTHEVTIEEVVQIVGREIYERFVYNIDGTEMNGLFFRDAEMGNSDWVGFVYTDDESRFANGVEQGENLYFFRIEARTGDVLELNRNTVENPFVG